LFPDTKSILQTHTLHNPDR